MKKLSIAFLHTAIVAACSPAEEIRVGPGDAMDVGTTTVALNIADGFSEANPLLASCGPAAAVCALGGKYALKTVYVESGFLTPEEANAAVEVPGAGAAAANVAVMAGMTTTAAALFGVAGLVGMAAHMGLIPPHVRSE